MDVLERVSQLAERSRNAPTPPVDIRMRIRTTLRERNAAANSLLDTPSLAFAGLSVAVTGILFTVFLPSIQILWDPWAAYLNAPWSI